MSKFKVGDKVRCIDVTGSGAGINRIYLDSTYKVALIMGHPDGAMLKLEDVGNWNASRFELALTPRAHCDLVKAWAEGNDIVWYNDSRHESKWQDTAYPKWRENRIYAVKGQEPEIEPPKVKISIDGIETYISVESAKALKATLNKVDLLA